MDYEPRHAVPELNLPPKLAFMSVEQIDAFRNQQQEAMLHESDEAALNATGSRMEASNEVRDRYKNENEATCEAYVSQHLNRDDNPQLFDSLKQIVIATSIHNMSHSDWVLGEKDDEGLFSRPETSGQSKLETTMAALLNMAPTAEEVELEDTPEIIEARTNQAEARQKLAELSVQRRRQFHGFRGKKKQQAYEQAVTDYNAAQTAYGAAAIAQLRSKGVSEPQLFERALKTTITEHGQFTATEKELLESDTTRRGGLARFLGKTNARLFTSSALLGFGVGIGTRAALAAFNIFGVAGGAIAGGAVGAANSLFTNRAYQYNLFDKRAESDTRALDEQLHDMDAADSVEDSHKNFVARQIELIGDRIKSDRSSNRKRLIGATAIGAASGALGTYFADVAVSHHWLGLGAHHSSAVQHKTYHPPADAQHGGGPNGNGTSGMGHGGAHHHGAQGHTNGFKDRVYVQHGHGYANELQDLANQKHINLTGQQSWNAYQHVADKVHGHMFTNDPSYVRSAGDYGISHAGYANWSPHAVHAFQHWLENQGLVKVS